MSDKPRTKASYAKPITLVPLRNPYSVLASPSRSYSQAAQRWSPPSPSSTPEQRKPNPSRPSPTRPPPFNPYFNKTCSIMVKILERDEITEGQIPNLFRIFPSINGKITQYYLQGCQQPPKTQEYYEFILVDTDSIEVTHRPEPNSEIVAYSKCKIKKFITKEEWGNPYKPRMFSQKYMPSHYNYFDYQEAWLKALYLKPTDHSWFFSFSQNFDKRIPNWVHQWWVYFGLTRDILPEQIQKGWDYFHEHLKTPLYGNKPLMFAVEFQVPWIMGWDLAVSKTLDHQFPPVLERRFRIKWWKNFQPSEKLSMDHITKWFIIHNSPQQFPKIEQNTTSPSSTGALSKKELKKKLLEEISQLGDSDEEDDFSQIRPGPASQLCYGQDPYEDYDII